MYFRDALITSSINCFTSFFAGFAVFAVLGHMATIQGKEVRDVARSGKSIQGRCKITIGVVGMKLFRNTFSRVVIFEDILSRYRFSNYRLFKIYNMTSLWFFSNLVIRILNDCLLCSNKILLLFANFIKQNYAFCNTAVLLKIKDKN